MHDSPTFEVNGDGVDADVSTPVFEQLTQAEESISALASMLQSLQAAGHGPSLFDEPPLADDHENHLLQVRLGVASSLLTALRSKDVATAKHSVRVAFTCSSWAAWMGLDHALRDQLELGALLHDVGKIGVPDVVLLKAGPLDAEEVEIMDRHRAMGLDILRSCCAVPEVLEIVQHAAGWFDGSHASSDLVGEDIPLGARVLSIADAFDAMTSDHVYRSALSRERATGELYRYAGRQFDPALVDRFIEFQDSGYRRFEAQVARDWLVALDPDMVQANWRWQAPTAAKASEPEPLFRHRLLENMHDAVVFVDLSLRIVGWNPGAERLTGITGESAFQRQWLPAMLAMRDERSRTIADEHCPVAYCIRTRTSWYRRLLIRGRDGRFVAVDAHALPVISSDGASHGAALILRDASQQRSLEERCQDLHEMATKDPLTQLANRAEFDRVQALFVAEHRNRSMTCSLIVCDIDRFKQVNDTYGHQAGDAVIQCFAKMLMAACHAGDLAARYGGEEFVLLCADCDNAAAARRAEELRAAFGAVTHDALGGGAVTVSFGVTALQPGDTPQTLFRRADRALLAAKGRGRNQVVQLGTGLDPSEQPTKFGWAKEAAGAGGVLVEQDLISEVPVPVCIEKLRGFIADHHADVVAIHGEQVELRVNVEAAPAKRRGSDRPVTILMQVDFAEVQDEPSDPTTRTKIHVRLVLQNGRNRRHADTLESAKQLLSSFRAYLMASVTSTRQSESPGMLRRAKRFLIPWFNRSSE